MGSRAIVSPERVHRLDSGEAPRRVPRFSRAGGVGRQVSDRYQRAEPRASHPLASPGEMASASRARATARRRIGSRCVHITALSSAASRPCRPAPRLREYLIKPLAARSPRLARKWRAAKSIVGYDVSRSFRRLARKTEATASKVHATPAGIGQEGRLGSELHVMVEQDHASFHPFHPVGPSRPALVHRLFEPEVSLEGSLAGDFEARVHERLPLGGVVIQIDGGLSQVKGQAAHWHARPAGESGRLVREDRRRLSQSERKGSATVVGNRPEAAGTIPTTMRPAVMTRVASPHHSRRRPPPPWSQAMTFAAHSPSPDAITNPAMTPKMFTLRIAWRARYPKATARRMRNSLPPARSVRKRAAAAAGPATQGRPIGPMSNRPAAPGLWPSKPAWSQGMPPARATPPQAESNAASGDRRTTTAAATRPRARNPAGAQWPALISQSGVPAAAG